MLKTINHTITIPLEYAGLRLDQALAKLFPQYSRSRLKTWLKAGQIQINEIENSQPKDKVSGGEQITLAVEMEDEIHAQPEDIDLMIVYEDSDILVINKPVGMVVHPAVGNRVNTLLNALLYHTPQLAQLPRAGIVHRLDKETSGLLVVAKTLPAHTYLVRQLQRRKFDREYVAIVTGVLTGGGTIDAPIGRHPKQRLKMAVVEKGKPAKTHYRVIERFKHHTLIKVKLDTGRTHQIRVHMSHTHHPIVGDQLYSGRMQLPKGASQLLIGALKTFKHQALHARKLGLKLPSTKEYMSWEVEAPQDFKNLLNVLQQDNELIK